LVVNESVLQLTGFITPDPTAVFHAPRGLRVRTASNIQRVVGDPAAAARVPEVARLQEGGEDGGGGRPEARDDYVAAAYFAPALRTDARGRAHFAFEAPTDLSAYRVMAVVAAKDDRVGSGEARVTVQKPVSARPLVPRFASRGDTLELGALVHDQDPSTRAPIEVRFAAEGIALEPGAVELPGDGTPEQLAHTLGVVGDAQQAFFEVEVHKGKHADRVRRTLQVRQPLDTELRVLALGRAPAARTALRWPAGVDPARSQLEVTVDRVGLAPLAPVLAQVLDYPYGCTEQTAAALAAIAAAPELTAAIAPELAKPEQLRARVADGVARLLAARTADDQFGLYPDLPGRPWMTALVLETALALRAAGFSVPDALTTDAAAALAGSLARQNPRALDAGSLAVSAHAALLLRRAGTPRDALEEQLWQLRARLPIDAKAHLLHALALRGGQDARRAELRAELAAMRWIDRLRDPEQPLLSAERTTALALSALIADAKDEQAQAKLAAWLAARAADPEVYLSTRDIADTLTALASFARKSSAGASRAEVGIGKQVLWQGSLSGAQVVALTRSAANATDAQVWIKADGDVSFSIRRRDVSKTSPRPAFAHGISLQRRYLDPKTHAPLTKVALGQTVQVELELRADHAVRMAALGDPLPAGLEPLDPELANGRVAACSGCENPSGFDYIRRHDDRIEAFAEWLAAGTHTLRYLARASIAGSFAAPGATAELMYMPDLYGRSSVTRVDVAR
jgi:uncharacterized protein YfaS (alpha-2-macroglobulin family)